MPKVSIIVPVWNKEKTIERTINSLLNQTIEQIEIILVNDGSKDNSKIILNKYQNKYPEKIKVINKENGGLSSARNAGIKKATGEYITFLDAGDYLDINLLKKRCYIIFICIKALIVL